MYQLIEPVEQDIDFLFDDFFVSQDPTDKGERVEIELRGRTVPLFLKRGLSLSDREAAKSQAVKTRIKPNGQVEIVSMNETIFATELMFRCIKSWPFKYSDGSPVEITRENIQAMFSDAADTIASKLLNNMQSKQDNRAPFLKALENPSDAV